MESTAKRLEDININFIDSRKVVKSIKFSEKFDEKTCDEKIEYLIALSSSLNHAAETAYKERDELAEKFEQVLQLNENAAKSATMSHTFMEQAITEANKEKQELSNIIAKLKSEIREKDYIINQLGGVDV